MPFDERQPSVQAVVNRPQQVSADPEEFLYHSMHALVYEAAGAGIKVTVDQVPADGPAIHYAYTANYDGKDVPVVGSPNGDTAARTRVNATATTLVNKQGGKILSTLTLVVSADGKTLTITTTGQDAKGQKIDSVTVYDKQ
jgi:hypothetical protein